jgi:hypothetical protein
MKNNLVSVWQLMVNRFLHSSYRRPPKRDRIPSIGSGPGEKPRSTLALRGLPDLCQRCERCTHLTALLAAILIATSCSVLNQPINPDGGSGESTALQQCQATIDSFEGSCHRQSGLLRPCLRGIATCGLSDCDDWGSDCAQCLFGPCCQQHVAYQAACSIQRSYPSALCNGIIEWEAWRQCALLNCTAVCKN